MDVHIYVPGFVYWLVFAFLWMKAAEKLNCENTWFAFVPILNLFLLCDMARKSYLWLLLLLIPIVGFFAWILLWMAVAARRRKEPLLGVGMLVPGLNVLVVGYLGLSE
jgi:hypothetical protein